ncbi:AfsA-related hotdog domain-containing protein [Plantactinospora sp. ZYX-F-223]|uniref:AfsA-related hotdog domain-containing protein n=1 Tax=Plantactinospora sp. ZYX-F-223 TaxID=3144103 RepID=UPI0031FC5A5C
MSDEPADVWVVGESFVRATGLPDVLTVGELHEEIARAAVAGPARRLRVHAGLGVDATTWRGLRVAAETDGAGPAVEFGPAPPDTIPRHRVIKRRQDNVLVGEPTVVDGVATAALVVPNETELLTDHTAERQHVPGVLLIEAGIQLLTWLVDELVPATPDGVRRYPVMHACRFDFPRFVFPFAATLRAWLEQTAPGTAERVPLVGHAQVSQGGRVCAECVFEVNAFDPRHVFEIEHAQALRAAATALPEPKEAHA